MDYQTLANTPNSAILEAFNQAFSDYINPTPPLSEKVFNWKIQRDGMQKPISSGMYTPTGELVGFMLHAVGKWKNVDAVYNGGTGVVPGYRAKGGGTAMYDFILPKLKEAGISGSILECIIGNDRALKLYDKVGFKIDRELVCYSGEIKNIRLAGEGVYWKELDYLDWPNLRTFWDCIPSWQNSIEAINRVAWSYRHFGIFKDELLLGYGIINPLNGYIPQFGSILNIDAKA